MLNSEDISALRGVNRYGRREARNFGTNQMAVDHDCMSFWLWRQGQRIAAVSRYGKRNHVVIATYNITAV